MPDLCSYDYAIVRVVPRVERQEFINVGVIVSCVERDFLAARIELDEPRLIALDRTVDLTAVRNNLASIPLICRGGPGPGRSAGSNRANASTGWWHRAARSSRPRGYTSAAAWTRRHCWSI